MLFRVTRYSETTVMPTTKRELCLIQRIRLDASVVTRRLPVTCLRLLG